MASGRWSLYRTDGALPEMRQHPAPLLKPRSGGVEPNVDLRDRCTGIEDQGQVGSCTGCAVVGALEFLQKKLGGPDPDLSILFNYYNARLMGGLLDQDIGAYVSHAVAAPLAYGVCEDRFWSYDPGKIYEKPPAEAYSNAQNFEAVQFARVEPGDQLMRVLSNGYPIIISTWFSGEMLVAAAQTGHMPVYKERAPMKGGHAMLLVGYDRGRKEWLVRNSWGADYGLRGYLWIPDESFVLHCYAQGFWVIGDLERPNTFARFEGPSTAESIQHMRSNGPEYVAESLRTLKTDVRKDLQDHLDDTKKSVRDRLRAQMAPPPPRNKNEPQG